MSWGKPWDVGEISVEKAAGNRKHGCSRTSNCINTDKDTLALIRGSDLLLSNRPVVSEL